MRIPQTGPSIAPQALPAVRENVRANADNFGGAMGAALQGVGQQVQGVAQRALETDLRERMLAFDEAASARKLRLTNARGRDAIEDHSTFDADLQAAAEQILEDTPAAGRRALDLQIRQRAAGLRQWAAGHVAGETRRYEDSVNDAEIATNSDNLIANGVAVFASGPADLEALRTERGRAERDLAAIEREAEAAGPDGAGEYTRLLSDARARLDAVAESEDRATRTTFETDDLRRRVADAVRAKGRRAGLSDEEIAVRTSAAFEGIHGQILAQANQNDDAAGARRYFDRFADEMSPRARAKAQEVVDDVEGRVLVRDTADAVMADYPYEFDGTEAFNSGQLAQALAAVDERIDDPELNGKAKRDVQRRFQEAQARNAMANEALKDQLFGNIDSLYRRASQAQASGNLAEAQALQAQAHSALASAPRSVRSDLEALFTEQGRRTPARDAFITLAERIEADARSTGEQRFAGPEGEAAIRRLAAESGLSDRVDELLRFRNNRGQSVTTAAMNEAYRALRPGQTIPNDLAEQVLAYYSDARPSSQEELNRFMAVAIRDSVDYGGDTSDSALDIMEEHGARTIEEAVLDFDDGEINEWAATVQAQTGVDVTRFPIENQRWLLTQYIRTGRLSDPNVPIPQWLQDEQTARLRDEEVERRRAEEVDRRRVADWSKPGRIRDIVAAGQE